MCGVMTDNSASESDCATMSFQMDEQKDRFSSHTAASSRVRHTTGT